MLFFKNLTVTLCSSDIYLASSTGKKMSFINTQSYTKSTLSANTVLPLVAVHPSPCIRHCIEIIIRIIRFRTGVCKIHNRALLLTWSTIITYQKVITVWLKLIICFSKSNILVHTRNGQTMTNVRQTDTHRQTDRQTTGTEQLRGHTGLTHHF